MNIIEISDINFLENKDLLTFYSARECHVYYESCSSIESKREFYQKLFDVYYKYLDVIQNQESAELINKILQKTNRKLLSFVPDGSGLKSYLNTISPEGFKLLNVSGWQNLSIDSLTRAYRIAASKYHPDKGGDKEKMQIVNEAYPLFFQAIANKKNPEAPSLLISDYYYLFGLDLFLAHLDEWAVDKAYKWFVEIFEYYKEGYKQLKRKKIYDESFSSRHSKFSQEFHTLMKRLYTAGLKNEAYKVFYMVYSVQLYIEGPEKNSPTSSGNDLVVSLPKKMRSKNFADGALSILLGKKEYYPILNHHRQLENAKRLNFFSDLQLARAERGISEKKEKIDLQKDKLEFFKANHSFLLLPSDKDPLKNIKVNHNVFGSKTVPIPRNCYLSKLTVAQKKEYSAVFSYSSAHTNVKNIQKYIFVRLYSITLSVIYHYNEISNIEELIEECELLSELYPVVAAISYYAHISQHITTVKEFVCFISKLNNEARGERLNVLGLICTKHLKISMKKPPTDGGENRYFSYGFYKYAILPISKLKKDFPDIFTLDLDNKNKNTKTLSHSSKKKPKN